LHGRGNKQPGANVNKKKKQIVGIDVSAKYFDAHWNNNHEQYPNCADGFRKLLKDIPADAEIVFEATGNYHYRLATFLTGKKRAVKVLNPLQFKRWSQAQNRKAKTDKADSRDLAEYAQTEKIKAQELWQAPPQKLERAKLIASQLHSLAKMSLAAHNRLHATKLVVAETDDLCAVMGHLEDYCKEQTEKLTGELYGLVKDVYPKEFRLLKTIPGFGSKTAAVMLASIQDFRKFETHRRLSSFAGFAVRVNDSGDTVRGKGRMVKTGCAYMRGVLYMPAMTAAKFCKPCKALYERLIAKGKANDVALVAVMHRMVKIAFGVIKSGEPYRGGAAANPA
jgi:transposase